MNYIKDILREKGMSVKELAEKLEVSRQALSKQIQGKMLVETAEKIATALDVPLWRLFASSEEVTQKSEINAFIECKNKLYKATTIDELKTLTYQLEKIIQS